MPPSPSAAIPAVPDPAAARPADAPPAAAARRAREAAARLRAEAEQARAEAERANRARSEFLAVMSHELRTPLNAIGGYAELLALGLHGPLTAGQADLVGRILRSQQHLLGLITSVLTLARLEAGRVAYRADPVPLADLVREASALVTPLASERGLALEAAPAEPAGAGAVARADRERLAQVLLNLLSNAMKFTDRGGRVDLAWGEHAGGAFVRVRDTGCGIPADRLEAVFDPFVQADLGRTRRHGGAGLGLAVARDLARGMGGDLTAESTPGVGSTFTVVLPRG